MRIFSFKALMYAMIGLGLLLTSCENDVVREVSNQSTVVQTRSIVNQDFEIIDGYVRFTNMNTFNTVYQSMNINSLDIYAWPKNHGYESLFEVYEKEDSNILIPERDVDPDEEFINKSNRLLNRKMALLLNKDGMFMISDTIYKTKGEYIYVIPNADFKTVSIIENTENKDVLNNIIRFEHTKRLTPMTRNYDRSPVFEVDGGDRREHVKFNSGLTRIPNAQAEFWAEMEGRAQTKGLWWHSTFEDELVWGETIIEGGSFVGFNGQTTIGRHTSGVMNGTVFVGYIINLGAEQFVNNVKVKVTFRFMKHIERGTESYTNQYSY